MAQQTTQFLNLPGVQQTGGRVTSFETGGIQSPSDGTDILYVNAPVGSGGTSSVTAGIMLNQSGFATLLENEITFPNTSNLVEALGDYDGDGLTDFAFAFVPQGSSNIELCVYYGTGATVAQAAAGESSFKSLASTSGCLVFPTNQVAPPVLSNMASFVRQTNGSKVAQLLLEDSANGVLYIINNNGTTGSNGNLQGYSMQVAILSDGAGPIYVGDFNGDGYNDFIINGQTGHSASAFISSVGYNYFVPTHIYTFDKGVRSMLIEDMDHDGIADMVVEGNDGSIEIHKGNGDGTFATASEGGTAPIPGSVAGNGGRLAVINPRTLDILSTTPIGLSLLRPQSGTLTYALSSIYNIGPGRSSFSLADYHTTGNLDLAVDSAEGVVIFAGNPDGTFVASNAYSALAPGLGAVAGKFRNAANNPTGNVDVMVATGATQARLLSGLVLPNEAQAQLMKGNGDGTFAALSAPVNTSGGPANIPNNVWSNLVPGDYDGDNNLDILFSMTGLPQPPPSGSFPIWYVMYGNGDGTFNQSGPTLSVANATSNIDGYYLESVGGDFNGDGISDVAISDDSFDATAVGVRNNRVGTGPDPAFLYADSNNTAFNQVAAGFFKGGRSSQQDLVFEQGMSFIPFANSQNGAGNFTQMAPIAGAAAPLYPSTVLLTDVDGDGNGDLVVVYYNTAANPVGAGPVSPYQVYIWWGNGDGTFTQTPLVLNTSRNYYLGAVADMNGDGLPDLALSDGSVVSILYNQGGRSFGALNQTTGLYANEQHFLAGQGINSISLVDVNGDGRPDLVAANGGATIANAVALGGRNLSSISLTTNPADISTGGITVLINHITTKPVTGTLVASPEPSAYGQSFTMTATLTPSAGVAVPTGTVTFSIDGVQVGNPVNVVPGTTNSTASYTVPQGNTYAGGVHPMTAAYSGDAANSQASFAGASGTHLIQNGATTSFIEMCIGPTAACPAPPGVAVPTPVYTPALTMSYGQIWNGFISAAANDGSALTGSLELIDTYTGSAAPPPNPLCTLPVNLGGACANSVGTTEGTSVGLNVLTAYYPGDASHSASTSAPIAITVLPDSTSVTLTGSPNPSPVTQPVSFTATVTGNFAAPTGPIAFFFGNTLLGQVPLVPSANGNTSTATLSTSILPVGSDPITAAYGPTMDFAAASATFTETITPAVVGGFTLSVTPATSSVGVGYSTLLVVTVTPQGGFSQGVNLSCAGLPNESTCFFDSQTLSSGAYTTDLVVSTTSPHSCGTSTPYFLGSNSGGTGVAPFALPAIAGLLAMFLPGRRRWMRALLAVIVVAGMTQMSGCGTCTDLGTRPATYTFQVWGSATGTSELETQPVTITVTI